MEKEEIMLDDESIMEEPSMTEVVDKQNKQPKRKQVVKKVDTSEDTIVSCLRNERIIVKHVPKETGIVRDPKHILYGGMAEGAVRWLTVPKLTSGTYVNVLTNAEKQYLEEIMGLEYNALSIYNKVDNFWDNFHVRLTKQDNIFNLKDPDDYIKYKVLLANKDIIAPSLQELEDHPKATYQFVVIRENEESTASKKKLTATMKAYMEFGKIQDNADMLKMIIETIDGRPVSKNSKIEFLQDKVGKIIQADAKLFLKISMDPLLETKILIKKSVEEGLISNRGGMFYLRADGTPLCGNNEEPTLNTAAKYLNLPKNQDLLFSLQAKLKQ